LRSVINRKGLPRALVSNRVPASYLVGKSLMWEAAVVILLGSNADSMAETQRMAPPASREVELESLHMGLC
jgi:hypothetical protein